MRSITQVKSCFYTKSIQTGSMADCNGFYYKKHGAASGFLQIFHENGRLFVTVEMGV